MSITLTVLTALVAMAAGARSTWSPCGRSMLSTITPMGERGRGNTYGGTAAWFIVGAVVGGLTLGAVMAAMAAAIGMAHVGAAATGSVVFVAALVASASDARLGGWSLPIHRRQVNERWLDGYRSWVYGLGFGWQIGTGLATYVMTAAVYLLVLMGAMGGRPLVALAAGVLFGTVRGLAVLWGRRLSAPDRLASFHHRFDALDKMARHSMVGIEVLVGTILASMVRPVLGGMVALLSVVTWSISARFHRVSASGEVPAQGEIRPGATAGEGYAGKKFAIYPPERVTMVPEQRRSRRLQ
jgi:hypothetical protein